MSFKIDFDPCSNRWICCLPDEEGRPRIEADTPELLEQFLCDVEAGIVHRNCSPGETVLTARSRGKKTTPARS